MTDLRLWSAAALALLIAQAATATTVTITLQTSSGVSAENAVIVLDPLDQAPPPTTDRASIDQINKQFVPKVTVVRTGTAVTFPNSDQIRHQVYSFSPAKSFNLKLYAGSPASPEIFDKPGLVVLGCNIHDKMLAFVAVVDSPYFAKVTSSGTVSLQVPKGRYQLRVWHPELSAALPPRPVEVTDSAQAFSLTIDLQGHDPIGAWTD